MDDKTGTAGAIRQITLAARVRNLHPVWWGLAAMLLVLLWQTATVHYNYGGNWSGLFCTSAINGVPPALADEHIYLFPTAGWDGQFYHYIAHDPLIHRDLWKHIDAPRLRYKRILVPALAYAAALGDFARIDWSYRCVILLSIFLGSYWLAQVITGFGFHPAWGLAFCLLPATIVSIDRMAVDAGLMALCIAFVYYGRKSPGGSIAMYIVLLCAALVRETGFFLTAGCLAWLAWKRHFGRAAIFATALVPAVAWYKYVDAHTSDFVYHSAVSLPFTGLLDRFIHPMTYPAAGSVAPVVMLLDYVALLGVVHALLLSVRFVRELRLTAVSVVIGLFALLMIFVWHPADWLEAFDYGRISSPLLALLAIRGFEAREWIWCAPLLMIVPRVSVQIAAQASHVVRGLLQLS